MTGATAGCLGDAHGSRELEGVGSPAEVSSTRRALWSVAPNDPLGHWSPPQARCDPSRAVDRGFRGVADGRRRAISEKRPRNKWIVVTRRPP